MKSNHILGLNSRNHLYLAKYNSRRGKRIADSKLLTKKFLRRLKLPHPGLIANLSSPRQVAEFDWNSLAENFVIKPAGGYAGEGIMLIRKRISRKTIDDGKIEDSGGRSNTLYPPSSIVHNFQLMDGSRVSLDDLKLHCLDILEGRFDRFNLPDTVMIEERVVKHPRFRRYAYKGTPDVRVIIFNGVPVMAALRLPTPESKGRANIHQGAIICGVDLATGVTTRAAHWDRPITTVPDANLKLSGIEIPDWERILELTVEVQSQARLGYMAVDFLLDPMKGPLIVELTARPGLGIQIANMAGLGRRLERVEGLTVQPGQGIAVAKALFAERFTDKVIAERGVKVVGVFETIKLRDAKGIKREVAGKIDTGAFRTSVDRDLAEELGLMKDRRVLWHDYYVSSLGREKRPIIPVTLWLAGRKIETTANVSDRGKLKEKLLIGRRDLGTFVVKPAG